MFNKHYSKETKKSSSETSPSETCHEAFEQQLRGIKPGAAEARTKKGGIQEDRVSMVVHLKATAKLCNKFRTR